MNALDSATDRARKAAGNWKKFESFYPDFEGTSDPENWSIFELCNRDSDLLTLSNQEVIEKALKGFEQDVILHRNRHWACGWTEGITIRVYYANGKITPAFQKLSELLDSLESYPVLDDEDLSRREYEATIENIESEGGIFVKEGSPLDWASKVFSWLWDNDQQEVECIDGGGGYPSREAVKTALEALGFNEIEEK